ncbi:UDP-N-acetylmuramoyl-tripeptide--D-alanyl-D-alanine ligase [Reyranella sp. CPCC 100927]|uniref:UDP-N-acetylmuramoyl-tripeptide--D-alanyl-D- alanine ligase n=1 Tax=Reyranella sp. CPCC 100927 TaxID=2599616 RepID=UPI0011B572C0|nr:UDP-N-acetylmuramoyl-tripeptide--D-alanyl-D-alanine ligase [Reyranella sp. CPCC 100927]TWT06079.1 UDP-N-acetylmuramoyl-tripeptide--D-alanyl-D-alanine ligase [Reyranella sp. CPCC 100927]
MSVMPHRTVLWRGADVTAASGGQALGGTTWNAGGISIDTRTLRAGDLFVALKGEAADGHAFVEAAFAKGAAAALVSDPGVGVGVGPLVCVPDTLGALEALGRAARARSRAQFVAVTGSLGKTSTKEALRVVLGSQDKTHAAEASYNNHIGVPLTLARLPADARYAVCEVGTNHPGEIEPLARMVQAHVGIITNVEAVHIGNFGSVDAIAEEKAKLFVGMDPSLAGGPVAVLPRDSAHFFRLAQWADAAGASRQLTFGEHEAAEYRLLGCDLEDTGSAVTALAQGRELRYRLGAPGRHWVLNSLAVLAASAALGVDVDAAAAALAGVAAPVGRGARRRVSLADGSVELIDESYNASPPSVRAMLALLAAARPGPGGRRLLVLGDMLELGADSEAMHVALAPAVEASGADLVFTAGVGMGALHRALPPRLRAAHAPDSSRLAQRVVEALQAGDVVAVKGSLGSKMKVIVEAILALGEARSNRTGGR